jgi:hypothetical protein
MPCCLVQLRLAYDLHALPCSPSSRLCASAQRHPRIPIGSSRWPTMAGIGARGEALRDVSNVLSSVPGTARCLQFASVTGVKEEMPSKLLGKRRPAASCGGGGGHDGAVDGVPMKPKNRQNSHCLW